MTEIIANDTINETLAELHCGEFPDLERMKVIIINENWFFFSLIQGLELLSWGSKHSCDRQFWCPCKLSQSIYNIKRVQNKNNFALICEIKPISGRPELYFPLCCPVCVLLISPSWPVASSSFLWLLASQEASSSLSTPSLTASPTSVCLAVYFLQLPLHMKDTRLLLFFYMNIIKFFIYKGSLFGSQLQLPQRQNRAHESPPPLHLPSLTPRNSPQHP